MSKKNGGPAFPCDQIVARDDHGALHGPEISSSGMTLRDYLAAKAMQGDMARVEWPKDKADDYASWAYIIADAMLRARSEP